MGHSCAQPFTTRPKRRKYSNWWTSSSAGNWWPHEPDEEGPDHYGWLLPGESRPGRVGLHSALQREQPRAIRIRAAHNQYSYGANGGHRGSESVEGTVRSGSGDGYRVFEKGNHPLGSQLETAQLDDLGQEARGEP